MTSAGEVDGIAGAGVAGCDGSAGRGLAGFGVAAGMVVGGGVGTDRGTAGVAVGGAGRLSSRNAWTVAPEIAKFNPSYVWPRTSRMLEVLMPITSLLSEINGPPELPWLIAASVCK